MKQKFLLLIGLLLFLNHHLLMAKNNDEQTKRNSFKDEFSFNIGIGSSVNNRVYRNTLPKIFRNSNPLFFNYVTDNFSSSKTPAFSLNYFLVFNKFISLQVSFSYSNMKANYSQDLGMTYTTFRNEYDFYTIYAGPRFTWYSNKNIRLYSSISLGLGLMYLETNTKSLVANGNTWLIDINYVNYKRINYDFQIYPIGLIIKDRYNIELGFGSSGIIKLGFIL